jgi:hypothetical protein
MGRGRAKAKQTKVARELKYSTASLDPDRLKKELESDPFARATSQWSEDDDESEDEDKD